MSRGLTAVLKNAVRAAVVPLARVALRHALLKRLARALLGRMPALRRRVHAILTRPEPLPPRRMHVPLDSNDLSPATQAAYDELKRRFKARKS